MYFAIVQLYKEQIQCSYHAQLRELIRRATKCSLYVTLMHFRIFLQKTNILRNFKLQITARIFNLMVLME